MKSAVAREPARGAFGPGLHQRMEVVEHVDLVERAGIEAGEADLAALGHPVLGIRFTPDPLDRGTASLGERLAPHAELRASQVETGLGRRLAKPHRRARERPEDWAAAGTQRIGHPVRDQPGIVKRDVLEAAAAGRQRPGPPL